MTSAQAAWLQAYATILARLVASGPRNTQDWYDLRMRAKDETNAACAMLGVSVS